MANENFLQQLASTLAQSATVENVFGKPVQAGDKIILPVARIAYGFGGGSGKGKRPNDKGAANETAEGEGSGGGGGLLARPKGVYEISETSTKFIPAQPGRLILLGMLIGFVLKAVLSSKHKCQKGGSRRQ